MRCVRVLAWRGFTTGPIVAKPWLSVPMCVRAPVRGYVCVCFFVVVVGEARACVQM